MDKKIITRIVGPGETGSNILKLTKIVGLKYLMWLIVWFTQYVYTANLIFIVFTTELAYVTTPICMVQAALVILNERESMPERLDLFIIFFFCLRNQHPFVTECSDQ
jgi:hypothetical protein